MSPPPQSEKKTSLEQNCLSYSVPWEQTFWRRSVQHEWQNFCLPEFYFCKNDGDFRESWISRHGFVEAVRAVCVPFREIELIFVDPFSIGEKWHHGFQLIWGQDEKHQLKWEGPRLFTLPLSRSRQGRRKRENGTWRFLSEREGWLCSKMLRMLEL